MKIIWSDNAKINFWKVVDYLYENWTEKEVLNFENKIDVLTKRIAGNTSLCPLSKISNLRKCPIDKNNSLIYLYENQLIYIVTIVDNRSMHQF